MINFSRNEWWFRPRVDHDGAIWPKERAHTSHKHHKRDGVLTKQDARACLESWHLQTHFSRSCCIETFGVLESSMAKRIDDLILIARSSMEMLSWRFFPLFPRQVGQKEYDTNSCLVFLQNEVLWKNVTHKFNANTLDTQQKTRRDIPVITALSMPSCSQFVPSSACRSQCPWCCQPSLKIPTWSLYAGLCQKYR